MCDEGCERGGCEVCVRCAREGLRDVRKCEQGV
jgi:hypothetical protein